MRGEGVREQLRGDNYTLWGGSRGSGQGGRECDGGNRGGRKTIYDHIRLRWSYGRTIHGHTLLTWTGERAVLRVCKGSIC